MIVQETRIRTTSGHQAVSRHVLQARGMRPYAFSLAMIGVLRTG